MNEFVHQAQTWRRVEEGLDHRDKWLNLYQAVSIGNFTRDDAEPAKLTLREISWSGDDSGSAAFSLCVRDIGGCRLDDVAA